MQILALNILLKMDMQTSSHTFNERMTTPIPKFSEHPNTKYWNYELNDPIKPEDVSRRSYKKYWFKCPNCNHNFDASASNITGGRWCPYCTKSIKKLCPDEKCDFCFKRSFASNKKSEHWHSTKNGDLTPRMVAISSGKPVWFKCPECKHDFEKSLDGITRGEWCAYCSHHTLCDMDECDFCFQVSFASIEKSEHWHSTKNGDLTPRMVTSSCAKSCWFKCPDCEHDFERSLDGITRGSWCVYCSHQALCDDECDFCFQNSFASNKKSEHWHSTKNGDLTPRMVGRYSDKICWFTCEQCNNDFKSTIGNITCGQWCSTCKHKTELKLYIWLKQMFEVVERQKTFEWTKNVCDSKRPRRFDYYIVSMRVLIELDGPQHFRQVSNWECPEQTKKVDIEKDRLAIENGYTIIRICQQIVWNNQENWESQLKDILDNPSSIPQKFTIGSIYEE